MRLIDADTLKYDLLADNYNAKMTPQEVADCIDNQPIAYDVEKVVKELKSIEFIMTENARSIEQVIGIETAIDRAKQVVRKGGVK